MADDMDDIEDLLEAPYKNEQSSKTTSCEPMSTSEDTANNCGTSETDSKVLNTNSNDNSNNINEHISNNNNNNNTTTNNNTNNSHHDVNENDVDKNTTTNNKDDQNGIVKPNDNESKAISDESAIKNKEKKHKHKSRSRSRSRHRKRSSRSTSKSKKSKRSKSKEKSKEKDYDRERDRDRDSDRKKRSSQSKNHDRAARSKSRSRSSSRRRRSRDDSRSRRRRHSRDRRRSRSPPKRQKSPDLTPEDRDHRTIFCMQLAARIRPRDLEEFFSAVGKVRDVRLITDPRTKRSKGIAYIEFRDIESVPLAIALTGQRLLGVPIIVKLTQAEKNRMPFTGPHIPANVPQDGPLKLYIGSLHVNITEDMLRGIFEPFGPIDAVVLARDDFARSKGYGYIQFVNAEDGKKAMEQLNNFELASRPIKVSLFISDKSFDASGSISNLDNDDLDRSGVPLGPSGKLALMAKLAEGTGLKVPQQTLNALNMNQMNQQQQQQQQQAAASNNGAPAVVAISSQCFLLSNMFDLAEEKQKPNWVEEISEDVVEECSKYGGVVHIQIDQHAVDGNIYIKCPTVGVAAAAMAGLNGRYFSGKMIKAISIPVATYHKQFPDSVNCSELLKPSL